MNLTKESIDYFDQSFLSKESIQFFYEHCRQRLIERYNMFITLDEYLRLSYSIMTNDKDIPKVFFRRKTKRLKTWFIVFQSKWIAVWYDKDIKLIRTILPHKLVDKNEDIINKGMKKWTKPKK